MGEKFQMLKSTSTDRPTRPRSPSSSKKPASPTSRWPSTPQGRQFKAEYLAVNPNAKVAAIDDDGITVFDSNAILLYSRKKPASFCRQTRRPTAPELLSWLMFVATGIGPFFRPGRPLQALRAGKDRLRPYTAISSRRAAPFRHSQRPSRQPRYMVGDTYTSST